MNRTVKRWIVVLAIVIIALIIFVAAEWYMLGHGGQQEVKVREIGNSTK